MYRRALIFTGLLALIAASLPAAGLPVQGSAVSENFTLVVLPDTQLYSWQYPDIFDAQTAWISANRLLRNIVFVTHEGDIVEHQDNQAQWASASASMGRLDGVVPYGVLPGNTDLNKFTGDSTNFNQYFPESRFSGASWYGGNYPAGKNDNSYQFFTGGGEEFVILHLIYCPMPDVIQWAGDVLQQHPEKRAIIVTHAYLDVNGDRNNSEPSLGCLQEDENTAYLWEDLAFQSPNVFLMLNGHEFFPEKMEVFRVDANAAGYPVYQLGANYQGRQNGGGGWLRLLEFRPGEGRVCVRTFSPWLNQFETDAESDFAFLYVSGQFTAAAGPAGMVDPCEPEPPPPDTWIYLPAVRHDP